MAYLQFRCGLNSTEAVHTVPSRMGLILYSGTIDFSLESDALIRYRGDRYSHLAAAYPIPQANKKPACVPPSGFLRTAQPAMKYIIPYLM
jgi:hypothetical protein